MKNEPANDSPDVAIAIAGPADRDALRTLIAAFRDHLRADVPSDRDLDAWLPRLLADASIEFAWARLGREPVGYTQTRFHASLWAPGVEGILEDLFVVPSARGRSVGRALLRHALERAAGRGARLLGLTTNEQNERAQRLYRSEGLAPQSARIWPNGREIRWVAELDPA